MGTLWNVMKNGVASESEASTAVDNTVAPIAAYLVRSMAHRSSAITVWSAPEHIIKNCFNLLIVFGMVQRFIVLST